MKEIERMTRPDHSDIESILSGCVMENGKLVPAPAASYAQPELYDYDRSTLTEDGAYGDDGVGDDVETNNERRSNKLFMRGLARTALVSSMVILPVHSADAFLSNRPFFEVNVIADIADRVSKADVIANNVSTTFTNVKTTTDNIVKLANGGK